MVKFLSKNRFKNENNYVTYINFAIITVLAGLLYLAHGLVFIIFCYHPLLVSFQMLGMFTCAISFFLNQKGKARVTAYLMIALICTSINTWVLLIDVGIVMRWYVILSILPMYFYSSLKKNDRIIMTIIVAAAFLISSYIAYYTEPMIYMPDAAIYNTICSFIIVLSIAIAIISYKYISDKRDSELKRVETILENVECGIIIIDAETFEIIEMNAVAERLYGDSKTKVIGKKCYESICSAKSGACPVKRIKGIRAEAAMIKANGDTVPIIKSVEPVWYNDRLVLLESFTDISELKEAERKLRILEVNERANQAKSNFLSKMSHEIRTPMNVIIGMTEIAKNTDDLYRLKRCFSTINISASHLLSILNDILDMSKIESGNYELAYLPFKIENVMIKAYNIMSEQAKQKQINFIINSGLEDNIFYLGDELRLMQVITNLVSNAIKFTSDGGNVEMKIIKIKSDLNADTLRFTVSDDGIGIGEEQMSKLFNAFEQADSSITRQYGGTGLGLSISKNIIEKMNGHIWVESRPKEGSVFTFEIKLERGRQEAEAELSLVEKKYPDFSGMVILLVEDLEVNREIITTLLEDTNIEIDEAENGLAAIGMFEACPERYSAIIMDIQMPVMDGYDATKAIRAMNLHKAKTIPIIALTADAFQEDKEKCLLCGMNDHMKKPVEIDNVLEKLSYFLTP